MTEPVWSGRLAADRFGISVRDTGGVVHARELVGVGLRRNPRRAHLLVSTVLGKHVPARPRAIIAAGDALGVLVRDALGGSAALIIGFAETATGLGHLVAATCRVPYLHTTRRRTEIPAVLELQETHSHASRHLLAPADARLLAHGDVAVIVDDELSTGHTAMNLIAALHDVRPRNRYLVAALVDARPVAARRELSRLARRIGARVDVVSVARATVRVPHGLAARSSMLAGEPQPGGATPAVHPRTVRGWPGTVRASGRHGFTPADDDEARAAAADCADDLLRAGLGSRLLVLGTEELMYAPLLIAAALADRREPEAGVRVSATTRSPAVVVDAAGYPLRTGLAFASHDEPLDGPGIRFAYNITGGATVDAPTDIVVVVDADTPALHQSGGLLAALAELDRAVHLVVLPTHADAVVGGSTATSTESASMSPPARPVAAAS
ncbi:MAG TPA: phosphoribosyltransferase domain-containing protein [Jatrophihabitantaceae bacterium]